MRTSTLKSKSSLSLLGLPSVPLVSHELVLLQVAAQHCQGGAAGDTQGLQEDWPLSLYQMDGLTLY